jgi:alpha-1,3-rhamnosyltransferase
MISHRPLISVVVYTYNLESYIEECLDSVYNLHYENIELIISDDASTDRTVELLYKWSNRHIDRFFRLEIVVASENRGQANNLNKGIAVAQGEYIKILAGDDILLPDVLDEYWKYISMNSEKVDFVYSNVHKFSIDHKNQKIFEEFVDLSNSKINQKQTNIQEQLEILIVSNKIWVATMMFSKALWQDVLFDERYSYYEDFPFVLNLTLKGFKIHFIPIIGAYYRRHIQSVQVSNRIFSNYARDRFRFKLIEIPWLIPQNQRFQLYCLFLASFQVHTIIGNNRNLSSRLLIKLLFYYYSKWNRTDFNIEQIINLSNQLIGSSQKKCVIS